MYIITGPKNLQQLMCELSHVVGWYHLGLHLGVPEDELKLIAADYPQDTRRCRTEMLSWWMKNMVEKKWATVVQALVKTGEKVIACKIAKRYGRVALTPHLPPLPTLPLLFCHR